jgi:hypothetical protein
MVALERGVLMVTIHFVLADGREVYSVGPVAWVVATDGSLHVGPDGGQIAHYWGGVWNVAGHDVPKCIVNGSRCSAHFEDGRAPSAVQGPFDRIEFIDRSVYGQPGRQLLAHLNEQAQVWYSYLGQQNWPKLVVD